MPAEAKVAKKDEGKSKEAEKAEEEANEKVRKVKEEAAKTA